MGSARRSQAACRFPNEIKNNSQELIYAGQDLLSTASSLSNSTGEIKTQSEGLVSQHNLDNTKYSTIHTNRGLRKGFEIHLEDDDERKKKLAQEGIDLLEEAEQRAYKLNSGG